MEGSSLDYTRIDAKLLDRGLKNFVFPPVFIIDTISHCTLRCSMCPHKNLTRRKGVMSWELYIKIIDEIAAKKPDARIWVTFAGEGSILKDLPEKIAYGKSKGLTDMVLNSNGTRLTEDFSKRLIQAGLDALMVGIDASTDETYQKLRIGGKLPETVANVLTYKRLLDKYGKEGQSMNVQFVQMPENEAELDDFVNFWNSQGIAVKIKPMVSWINKVDAANLLCNEIRLPCYWICSVMAITDTGKVALCGADLDCSMPMGDAVSDSLEHIWNDHLKNIRQMHLNGEWEKLPVICAQCNDWQSGYAKYASRRNK